ncbi:MAG: 2-succinyl-5-enolpyruvyl-6-hydroxy-3-cyclohexene-1-carboxylic-acid synthase [Balneolaceae bacterium]
MTESFSWMSTLMRSFYVEGVRHVFISPGSRSTPATLAAAVHPGLEKHIVLDERSAAFQALGTGKKSGVPALLICTSGTAAANYLPALVEARQSGIPMIVLTADRPPYLRNTGSSQTIDQIKMYGDYAILYHELGEPVQHQADLRRLESLAKQAVEESTRRGGAVHLNAPFRKPLEPDEDTIRAQTKLNREHIQKFANFVPSPKFQSRNVLSDELTGLINRAGKPLIIAGPDHPFRSLNKTFHRLAGKTRSPVFHEPGAGLPSADTSLPAADMFYHRMKESYRETFKPDLIIRFGDLPFSKGLQQALEDFKEVQTLQFLSRPTWQDDTYSVDHRILLPSDPLDTTSIKQKDNQWFDIHKEYADKCTRLRSTLLKEVDSLCDGHVIDHFSKHLDESWEIMLSNSFTVRDAALFGQVGDLDRTTFVNRGAAGIDGIISTALGIQSYSRRPMMCWVGDLAFFHDSNALLTAQKTEQPFVILVINNGGGTIFRMLPVYRLQEYYQPYFETPQQIDIYHIARAHGLRYHLIESKNDLKRVHPKKLLESTGTTVIECRTDADASMDLRRALWDHEL